MTYLRKTKFNMNCKLCGVGVETRIVKGYEESTAGTLDERIVKGYEPQPCPWMFFFPNSYRKWLSLDI